MPLEWKPSKYGNGWIKTDINDNNVVEMWNFFKTTKAAHHCIDTETNGLCVGAGGSVSFLLAYSIIYKNEEGIQKRSFVFEPTRMTVMATKRMMQQAKYVWAYNAPFDLNIMLNTCGEDFFHDYDFENWFDIMSLWRLTHNVDEPTENLQLKSVATRELKLYAKDMQDKIKDLLKKQEQVWNKNFTTYAKENGFKIKADEVNKLKKGDVFMDWEKIDFFNKYEAQHPQPNYWTVYLEAPEIMKEYNCWDTQEGLDLVIKWWPELIARGQHDLLIEEGKVCRAIAWQERNGITIDIDYLKQSRERVLEYYQYIQDTLKDIIQKSWDMKAVPLDQDQYYYESLRLFSSKTRKVKGKETALGFELIEKKVKTFLSWWTTDPLQLNINSSEQILLYMYYAFFMTSPTGSWDKVVMDDKEEAIKKILEQPQPDIIKTRYELAAKFIQYLKLYRRIAKWANTYIGRFIHDYETIGTGKIHPSFNGNKTVTGRFSSPFQQQPKDVLRDIRDPENEEPLFSPRRMVRCSPDALGVVVLDLSQIEIRVNAHYTHLIGHPDEVLDNVLFHGGDMHSITAASAFHSAEYAKDPQKAIELVQKNERNAAKSLNFAMQYGGSMNAISTHPVLGKLPHDVQNNLHKAFKTTRSGTIAYQDWAMSTMKTNIVKVHGNILHYVENMYGRRYFAPPVWVEKNAFKAINYLIQGTCADTLKMALVRLYRYFKDNNLKSRLIVNIHDEVQIEILNNEWFVVPAAKAIMETVDYETNIPILCDIEMYTDRWDNKKEYKWVSDHLELMEEK